jgi:hypothetical protein
MQSNAEQSEGLGEQAGLCIPVPANTHSPVGIGLLFR